MSEYWFRRKRFGWGLEPITKEGWMMTAFLMAVFITLGYVYGERLQEAWSIWEYFLALFIILFVFIFFADKKAEKPLLFKRDQHQKY